MTLPTPAIVSQNAVRRLPRLALLLFCLAYIVPGFVGRSPWKTADLTSFGIMSTLAQGHTSWLAPQMVGTTVDTDALLPHWIGAWSIQLFSGYVPIELAARLPFLLLLIVTLAATWYGTYHLARSERAQPVAFAFGGEASPTDYARSIADGAVLALIASLGLAQLSHEVSPAQVQLACAALLFYAVAALPFKLGLPMVTATVGLAGLTLSGAPSLALVFGAGACAVLLVDPKTAWTRQQALGRVLYLALLTAFLAVLASQLHLWRWRISLPDGSLVKWASLGRLLLWFTWPAGALAVWTLWHWRRQWWSRAPSLHLAWPILLVTASIITTLSTAAGDRSLLLALPALAALAAFALPTLGRSIGALVDWFTLLFFSGSAIVVWVVWIAMQTGIPSQPAANVARLAPGFTPSFSTLGFLIALAATLAWAWLVSWRVGRHRAAIWKSLVLPAGGVALCWLLLMTLWLPLLDYARSNQSLVKQIVDRVGDAPCVEVSQLRPEQVAALQFHSTLPLRVANAQSVQCPWLLVNPNFSAAGVSVMASGHWSLSARVNHPMDRANALWLLKVVKP